MFENFDFSWFLTIPGILTCLGCLLIIISIIIFISSLAGGKKGKKNKKEENNDNLVEAPIIENDVVTDASNLQTQQDGINLNSNLEQPMEPQVVTEQVAAEVTPVEVNQAEPQTVAPQVAAEVAPVEVNQVEPQTVTPQVAAEVAPVEVNQVEPQTVAPQVAVEVAPVEINPQPENQTVSVAPSQPNFSGINIEPTLEPVNTNVQNPSVANPQVETPPTEPKVIYGGADPLAGTGIVPTVTEEPITKKDEIESL